MHTSQLPPRTASEPIMSSSSLASQTSRLSALTSTSTAQAIEHLLEAYRQPIRSQRPDYLDLPLPTITQPHLEIQPSAARPPSTRPATPSEQQHRVYTLFCSHCDTFLSDRGMRAVLLLKPNITLFSTDASPLNTGPLFVDVSLDGGDAVERTCDCLTQSLGCHGCGSQIGCASDVSAAPLTHADHIVAPCQRCTQSVTKHQRSANGHRCASESSNHLTHTVVFHFGEVTAKERRYYPGEPGVLSQALAMLPRQPIPSATQETVPDLSKSGPPTLPPIDSLINPTLAPPRQPSAPLRRPLQAGDLVYWSHLRSGGERSEPVDPNTRPFLAPAIIGR